MKFQIMKMSLLNFHQPNGYRYRIYIYFWEESCCLKKKKKPLLRIAISLAAIHCWLHKVLGTVLWVNFPESVWGNCVI